MSKELPIDQRGFEIYGEFQDTSGFEVHVKESSSAEGPHCRVYISSDDPAAKPDHLHMNLAQAMRLRAALDTFIERVPTRWANGPRFMEQAIQELS